MKKMKYIAALLMAVMTVGGCGNEIPQMTQQEQDIITEYAAATFLKYSGKYEDKLFLEVEENDLKEEKEEVETKATETQETETVEPETEVVDSETTQMEVPTISENTSEAVATMPMAQFLGLDNFSVDYDGYEVCDSYSGADEGELAFGMNATAGKKLMVVKFKVTNQAMQEQTLDLFSKNVKVKVGVAGLNKNALLTMLENDLLTANTVLASNESKKFVVIIEIPQEKEAEISNITLDFSCDGKQAEYMF